VTGLTPERDITLVEYAEQAHNGINRLMAEVNRLRTALDAAEKDAERWHRESLDWQQAKDECEDEIARPPDYEPDIGPPAPGEGDDLPNPETEMEC